MCQPCGFNRVTQWDPPSWDNTFPEDMEFDMPEPEPEPEPEVEESKQKTTTTAAADTSSEVAKKLKEQFRKQVGFSLDLAELF